MNEAISKLKGGISEYFVQHREVSWLMLVALLVWGGVSYTRLAQQEDPKIPERRALIVTRFPGAGAIKMEQLVTKKIEQKVAELQSLDEISSETRDGVSIIHVSLLFSSQRGVDEEWNKLRAKLREVSLPQGCGEPWLDTDFGNTITLLYAITSPPISDAECIARANLVRHRLAQLRSRTGAEQRAAVVAFFPPAISRSYRAVVSQKFVQYLQREAAGWDAQVCAGDSFMLAEFGTKSARAEIEKLLERFADELVGADRSLHPDFPYPLVLVGDEDPLPQIRARAIPRYSYRRLEMLAEELRDQLYQAPGAGRVTGIGVVPEVVYLLFSIPTVEGYQISADTVMGSIAARNAVIPGGILRGEGHNFLVQLSGEFKNEQELEGAIVGGSADGGAVYLRDIFEVRRSYETPISYNVEILSRDGPGRELARRRSTLVAVEMKDGQIIAGFQEECRRALERFQARLPEGVEILTVSDQPKSVRHRIDHFLRCFIEAVVAVVIVAVFLMDLRSALVVALAIPLTVSFTFGGMHLLGVPLHQISIAALIIALGMLVDDPVVASDAINRELAAGQPRARAAWEGPFKLRHAILYATLINILAFLPLRLLPSDKGAFIGALPLVVTLALIGSRIVSMTFVPLLGYYVLRGQKDFSAGAEARTFPLFAVVDRAVLAVLPRYKWLLQHALDHPFRFVAIGYGLLALALLLTPLFGRQFFPPAERNQLLIDVTLPETASVVQTRDVCQQIVACLRGHPQVETAAVFAGGTAPRFYYNVAPEPNANHRAQVLVNTARQEDAPVLVPLLRDQLAKAVVGARCTVKQLEQGPAVNEPIQIRLSGDDLDVLRGLADQVAGLLRAAGGYNVSDDLGRRVPTLEIVIDQERANTLGVDNTLVGRISQAAFAGLPVTQLREGDHLVPVVIRLRPEERNEAARIKRLYVESRRQHRLIPLESFADVRVKPEYAAIPHYSQLRTVTVSSFSRFGELPSKVLERARPALRRLQDGLPAGYALRYAGEEKEIRESQRDMTLVVLVSLALITLAMVMQFNSVMKSLVVMLTVPLGLIGAFVGMALMRANFGFMAMLAMVSLAGVIVSHIIVLSDFIEEARREGMELKQALVQAGLVRLRAVLVTVLSTVAGLIPLALTGGALWHPLCSVHIFGLLFATVLTLVLLPVWYFLLCAKLKWIQ
ncbi:MAG: efflux RND transporter permease subunit [Verrucomicrobia bacterium]|nr:efflux RND transporter permease subunit [Verrucomicrobiota bacterium]